MAPLPFTGRYLRFEVVTSTGGNTGAAEVEVFSFNLMLHSNVDVKDTLNWT